MLHRLLEPAGRSDLHAGNGLPKHNVFVRLAWFAAGGSTGAFGTGA